ncbi:cytochrome b/b6 domain-containing protein [Arthrobacter crystallopoietes]|uniref:cytochrome b/b6 domain-containing protein n=1 Tax=Crystallibacter crystallopoietes TaxID=37928 RepID=UPI001FCA3067|nr:cytochrome b/b6 domain-containing protein [Arthrobacter crystallopoietes]
MTNENSAADPAPRRQRMAGYRPLTQATRQDQQPAAADDVDVDVAGTLPASTESPAAPEAPVLQPPKQAASQASAPSPAQNATAAPFQGTQAAAAAPAKRQRMGGYRPSPHVEQGTDDAGPAAEAPEPPKTPQPVAPVRKQRMGAQPAASTTAAPPGAAPADAPPATPVRKQRMGMTPSTSGQEPAATPSGKTRMGAAPAPAGSADTKPGTAGGTRQRMGAIHGQEATAAASPAPAQRDSAAPTRARMGTPTPTPPSTPTAGGAAKSGSGSAPPTSSNRPAPSGGATNAGERPAWLKPVVVTAVVLVLALVAVLAARWLRSMGPVQEFIAAYDGHASQPDGAPVGLPAWLGWQHFLNMFFIVLIIRTGLQVRTERKPPGYWTAKQDSFFSPKGNIPKKVSLSQWLHQSLDVLWVLNGLVFIVLLLATGQWMRIVPTSWDIFPNMLSAGIQYVSLDWPTENGWVHYNALQVMTYFITVFIAAPLAIISGIRISTWWPEKAAGLNQAYPVEWARAIHFPVMIYFVAFTLVHVFLVFFTGALRNLNHMYTSRDIVDWWGLIIFVLSLVAIAAAWFLTKPLCTTPVAARMGKVSK